jgi:hypothetical protein
VTRLVVGQAWQISADVLLPLLLDSIDGFLRPDVPRDRGAGPAVRRECLSQRLGVGDDLAEMFAIDAQGRVPKLLKLV